MTFKNVASFTNCSRSLCITWLLLSWTLLVKEMVLYLHKHFQMEVHKGCLYITKYYKLLTCFFIRKQDKIAYFINMRQEYYTIWVKERQENKIRKEKERRREIKKKQGRKEKRRKEERKNKRKEEISKRNGEICYISRPGLTLQSSLLIFGVLR